MKNNLGTCQFINLYVLYIGVCHYFYCVSIHSFRFSPLLEDDVLGPCLDKDDPVIVQATLSLLTNLVRSPDLVRLLCTCYPPAPCVPINCYDICLQTLPDDAHRQTGYTSQLQVNTVIKILGCVIFSNLCKR